MMCFSHTCKKEALYVAVSGEGKEYFACEKHKHRIRHLKNFRVIL